MREVQLQAGGDERRGGQIQPQRDAGEQAIGLLLQRRVGQGHDGLHAGARRAVTGQLVQHLPQQGAQPGAPLRGARPVLGGKQGSPASPAAAACAASGRGTRVLLQARVLGLADHGHEHQVVAHGVAGGQLAQAQGALGKQLAGVGQQQRGLPGPSAALCPRIYL